MSLREKFPEIRVVFQRREWHTCLLKDLGEKNRLVDSESTFNNLIISEVDEDQPVKIVKLLTIVLMPSNIDEFIEVCNTLRIGIIIDINEKVRYHNETDVSFVFDLDRWTYQFAKEVALKSPFCGCLGKGNDNVWMAATFCGEEEFQALYVAIPIQWLDDIELHNGSE